MGKTVHWKKKQEPNAVGGRESFSLTWERMGTAEREPWEEARGSSRRAPGQISPSWTLTRVPDRFVMEWLVITLAANFICQLRKCALSTSMAPITGFRTIQ